MFFGILWLIVLLTRRLGYSDGFALLMCAFVEVFIELMIFATWLN